MPDIFFKKKNFIFFSIWIWKWNKFKIFWKRFWTLLAQHLKIINVFDSCMTSSWYVLSADAGTFVYCKKKNINRCFFSFLGTNPFHWMFFGAHFGWMGWINSFYNNNKKKKKRFVGSAWVSTWDLPGRTWKKSHQDRLLLFLKKIYKKEKAIQQSSSRFI